jgi:hypothetical protein
MKWSAVISENAKEKQIKGLMHIDTLKTACEILEFQGANLGYKKYKRENDLYEIIYNLTNNGNMVMIYVNYGEEDNFCQLYLPDKVNDEQLNVYKQKYENEINKVNVYLSGVDGDVFKDTEIYKPGEFNIEEHLNKTKSR